MLNELPAEAKTVDAVRRLMTQLCEALDALSEGVSLSAADTVRAILAIRKEIVPVVDQRLTKSAELIRRGLWDEAVRHAAEPPELVQTATLLDISRDRRWQTWMSALSDLNIPAPPMPRMDLVAALIKAQDELVRLKPLLDAWRRMNLANAPLADRIAMLGKLRKADPENELWFETLQEHQKQRIAGLEREVAAAAKAQDDQRLGTLVAEMQQEWIEPVPPRIVVAAKAALERFRGGRIDRELDALADSLAEARDARDLDAGRTLRERWQELVDQKGSFAIDDPRLAAALPAVAWVDAHARMATVSEELWISLDARPGSLRVRQEWVRSLERLGNEMEDLAEKLEGEADGDAIERAHERIERQRAQLERDLRFRRMMMYVSIASAAVVLGLVVWYFDDRARYDASVASALRDLQTAQEKVASGVLQELPDFQASWPARIARNAEVSSLFAVVRGELEEQNGRRARLATALEKARDSLQAAEAANRSDLLAPWPPAFAEGSRSLADIEQGNLAVTDQEQADAARIKAAIDRLGKKFVGETDGLCRQRIAAFDTELDKARDLVAEDSTSAIKILEAAKPAIAALRAQAAAPAAAEASATHSSLRIASQSVVELLSPDGALMKKVASIEGAISNRRQFREALRELDRRLGDWRRYPDQLENIAREFETLPEARDYARAAESKAQWPAIDAWQEFQPCLQHLHLAAPEKAREVLANFEALPDEAKNLPMAKRFKQDVIPAIEQLANRDLAKLRADLESWFSGTWVGELKFLVKTKEGTAYYCLDGQQEGSPKFTYVAGRKDAEAGWPTKDERKTVESVEQSPQSRLADSLRAVVRKVAPSGGIEVDQLFVSLLEAVLAADDVDPVARLVTARKLFLMAAEYSRPFSESGRALETLLDDGQGSIPGVTIDQIWSFVPPTRDRDPEYQVTKQKAETLLREIRAGIDALTGGIAKERKVLTTPSAGSAQLVGRLSRNDSGDLVAVWRRAAPPRGRVWWFPVGADVAVAGIVDDKGVFRPGSAAGPAGTPLFIIESDAKESNKTATRAAGGSED